MMLTPDPNAFVDTLTAQVYAATATLNAGGPVFVDTTVDSVLRKAVRKTTPPDPYPQGWPKPWAIWRIVGHQTTDTEYTNTSGTDGTPNQYKLYVYEVAYVQSADREAEENQVVDIYAALATFWKPNSQIVCTPDNQAVIVSVNYQPPTPNGPFVGFGSQVWVGGIVTLLINEWYV